MAEVSEVSAVLFAQDHARVSRFYREALGLVLTSGDDEHSVLNCRGFELIVHQIPKWFSDTPEANQVAVRREHGRIRLSFPVDSVNAVRAMAEKLGGTIDAAPPRWAPAEANFFLGHDPEGNVFRVTEGAR